MPKNNYDLNYCTKTIFSRIFFEECVEFDMNNLLSAGNFEYSPL